MPITTLLFSDDIAKEINSCDSIANVGRAQYSQYKSGWRACGGGRTFRRGSLYPQNYGNSGNRFSNESPNNK